MGRFKVKHTSSMLYILVLFILVSMFFIPTSFCELLEGESFLTNDPPEIDGIVSIGEWNNASKMNLIHGYLLMQNDASNLYILFDVIDDTSANTSLSANSLEDYFWLSFDVDRDWTITTNEDVLFSKIPSRMVLGKAYHLRAGATTGLYETESQLGIGFGPSLNFEVPHRFWELAINLREINAIPYGIVNIGFRISSQVPLIFEEYPMNYGFDFSNLVEVKLGVTHRPATPAPTVTPSPTQLPTLDVILPDGLLIGAIVGISLGLVVVVLLIKRTRVVKY